MAVDAVVVLVHMEHRVEVLHRGNAQERTRNMDNGVHVRETDIEYGLTADHAITLGYGVKTAERLGAFKEVFLIGHRKRRTTQSDRTIDQAHMRIHDAAFSIDARAVRSARPAAYDDLLRATCFTHHLAQFQRAIVVRDDVDDLTIFKARNECAEEHLMSDGRNADHDELRALHCLSDRIGDLREFCAAITSEPVFRLRAGKLLTDSDAGPFDRTKA